MVDDKYDDQDAHAQPILRKDKVINPAEEQEVGGHFEGESNRERMVGVDREVVVDIFKRTMGAAKDTYFMRVSLRSAVRSRMIYRSDIDLDKYSSEREFLHLVEVSGGALAEHDNEKGANWDSAYVARQARAAAAELLHDIDEQK